MGMYVSEGYKYMGVYINRVNRSFAGIKKKVKRSRTAYLATDGLYNETNMPTHSKFRQMQDNGEELGSVCDRDDRSRKTRGGTTGE